MRRIALAIMCGILALACAARPARSADADPGLFVIAPDESAPRAGLFSPGMTMAQLLEAAAQYPDAAFSLEWSEPQEDGVAPELSVTLKDAQGAVLLEFLFADTDVIAEKKLLVDDPGIIGIRVLSDKFATAGGAHPGMTLDALAGVVGENGTYRTKSRAVDPYISVEKLPCILLLPDRTLWTADQQEIVSQLDQQQDSAIPFRDLPGSGTVTIEFVLVSCMLK